MLRTLLLPSLSTFALLAACAQQQAAPGAQEPMGACNAGAAQFAVGYASTDALAAEVRRRSGARLVRVIRPDEAVTQDFREDRVNLELGPDHRVIRVRCG